LFNFKALSFSSPDLKIFCKRFGLCVIRNQTHRQRNNQESKEQPNRMVKAAEETDSSGRSPYCKKKTSSMLKKHHAFQQS
jgi:hypothetical protein